MPHFTGVAMVLGFPFLLHFHRNYCKMRVYNLIPHNKQHHQLLHSCCEWFPYALIENVNFNALCVFSK